MEIPRQKACHGKVNQHLNDSSVIQKGLAKVRVPSDMTMDSGQTPTLSLTHLPWILFSVRDF